MQPGKIFSGLRIKCFSLNASEKVVTNRFPNVLFNEQSVIQRKPLSSNNKYQEG